MKYIYTLAFIVALNASALAGWYMHGRCEDSEGWRLLNQNTKHETSQPPVVEGWRMLNLPTNQTVFRGPWQFGFTDGIDCASQFMLKDEPVAACRDRKWKELKDIMPSSQR